MASSPAAEAKSGQPHDESSKPCYDLSAAELVWAKMQKDLEARGYMLRPRYHPGWVGSWVGTNKKPEECEDSIGIDPDHPFLMDAVRIKDGKQVMLKLWTSTDWDVEEFPVLRYFSDPVRANDPDNPCVPLLDSIQVWTVSGLCGRILVEPMLRSWMEPPFVIVAEALSWMRQTLQGLAYMHAHNVAHGDIHLGNIMMESSKLFPNGFHGAFNLDRKHRLPERHVKRRTRLQVPVKYYYIDFGSSSMFPSFEGRSRVYNKPTALILPEERAHPKDPHDPFKADVFALGRTLIFGAKERPELYNFICLFREMTAQDPNERPTAHEALEKFDALLRKTSKRQLRKRLRWSWWMNVSLGCRVRLRMEYVRLLVHSYWYGLPDDLLLGKEGT